MANKAFSKRMLDSKKHTGSGTHSYKWKYHPTPWKLFIEAVTKPRQASLSLFGNKRFVLGIVILIIILGGIVLTQGPLFHSWIYGPTRPSYGGPQDPVTTMWKATSPQSDVSEFNTICNPAPTSTCGIFVSGANKTLVLTPNSTTTAVALTKVSSSFSVLSGKQMYDLFTWNTALRCCALSKQFGFYLTTNGTLPTQPQYLPYTDPSVSFLWLTEATSSTTYDTFLFFKRGETQSIATGDVGCFAPSSTCFMHFQWLNATTKTVNGVNTEMILNFTGATSTVSSCRAPGVGNNCSTLAIDPFRSPSQQANVTSQVLPWFNFQSQSYYVGFYASFGLGITGTSSIGFTFDGNAGGASLCSQSFGSNGFPCMDMNLYIPSPTVSNPANIDTGGWFGPIIRALISIGVFIAQNIINFLAFLARVLFPVLATVFGILSNALVAVLNAIGNFFGLGNIGTTISNFFTAVGNFLVNGVGAIFGQITNAGSFVVNGITAFVNIAGSYWTKITSFFTALGNLLSIIGTVFNDLLSLGALSGTLALFMYWTWGRYKV